MSQWERRRCPGGPVALAVLGAPLGDRAAAATPAAAPTPLQQRPQRAHLGEASEGAAAAAAAVSVRVKTDGCNPDLPYFAGLGAAGRRLRLLQHAADEGQGGTAALCVLRRGGRERSGHPAGSSAEGGGGPCPKKQQQSRAGRSAGGGGGGGSGSFYLLLVVCSCGPAAQRAAGANPTWVSSCAGWIRIRIRGGRPRHAIQGR